MIMEKYKEIRPWGNFEQFIKNQRCTVKILEVNSNQALSLQLHHNREEFWKVIEGECQVTIGEKVLSAKKNDEFFINKETKHRIETENSSVRILEIAFGEFNENDIVRFEDRYNRN